jgi:hypothetical protein
VKWTGRVPVPFVRNMASYRADDGQRRSAAGVVARAVPEPVPRPVTDLDITGPGDGEPAFLAMWTRPPYGQVRLVRGDTPPHWRDGTRISQAEAAALTEIPMAALPGRDGRDATELHLPPGLHHVTPLTVGHNVVTVGRSADAWLVEPVAGLRADRRQDEVEVSWLWPQGATDALVRWPGGEQRRSHRAYKDEGATIFLTVGPAETTVEVRAVYSQRGCQVVSSCARFPVPARGVFVSHQVHGASRWRPREVTFELTAEQAVRLPPLVVVRGTEQDSPDDAYDGEVIDRRPPEDIDPGHPVSFTVTAPGGPRSVACFVDPAASPDEASAIVLFPPARVRDEDGEAAAAHRCVLPLLPRGDLAAAGLVPLCRRARPDRAALPAGGRRRPAPEDWVHGGGVSGLCRATAKRRGRVPGVRGQDQYCHLPGLP